MAVSGGWIFFIIVILVLVIGGGGAFAYYRLHKNRSQDTGFPPSVPGGIKGWFNNTLQSIKNRRSRTDAGYEGAGYAGVDGSGRGTGLGRAAHGGPLDPDEAWDSRVGNEADVYGPGGYYEETELGLHPQSTAYSGAAYGGSGAGFAPAPGLSVGGERGRSRSPGPRSENPFGDDAASSLRSISPRPFEAGAGIKKPPGGSRTSSPTGRRSMFREDMS